MKMDELRGKTRDQLLEMVTQGKKELFNLRFQKGMGEGVDPHRKRKVRRGIARVKTQMRQMESQG